MSMKKRPVKTQSYAQWCAGVEHSIEAEYARMQETGEAAPQKLFVMPAPEVKPSPEPDRIDVIRRLLDGITKNTAIAVRLLGELEEEIEEEL